MDWQGDEGRALLWKAFPMGFLPKRGVLTVGGCQIVGATEPNSRGIQSIRVLPHGYDYHVTVDSIISGPHHLTHFGTLQIELENGDLLPLPDVQDIATWTLLCAGLYERRGGLLSREGFEVLGYFWQDREDAHVPRGKTAWMLGAFDRNGWNSVEFAIDETITDPEEALVHALIQAGDTDARR